MIPSLASDTLIRADERKTRAGKPFERAPEFVSFGIYKMKSDGLWVEIKVGKGDEAKTESRWVCSPFEILGEARDEDGKNWSKLLRWVDRDKRQHELLVADASLHGDPASLAALLAGEGLSVEPERRKALASYLIAAKVRGRVTRVLRTGWHSVNGMRVFVMPDEVIGNSGAERVLLSTTNERMYRRNGSLSGWCDTVGKMAGDHALARIAIAAALAGPLLDLTGEAGGGVHFEGFSSRGKSTLQYCAASVWGEGGDKGFMRTWSATSNALEAIAALMTDTVLVLDEMNQIDAKAFHHVVYSIANGKGKGRANRDGGSREPKSWRVMVVSSGEMTVAAKLSEERGKTAKAGQLVRLLDIPAERGFGFGCFDHAGQTGDANDLATKISDATRRNYGWAGPEFVRRLIADDVTCEDVMELVNRFVADNAVATPGGADVVDPQVKRVAKKFGIIAAAGELATQLGVLPWRKNDSWSACIWAFDTWVARRGGTASSEDQQHLRVVKLFIELHGEARFEVVGSSERVVANRAGWKRGDGDERVWHFSPEVFQTEVCAGFKPSAVAETLARHGCLKLPGGRGLQDRVRINKASSPIRVYTVTAAIMRGDDDEA